MIIIGENIHIISPSVREALEKKDENFVKNITLDYGNTLGVNVKEGINAYNNVVVERPSHKVLPDV